MSAVQGLEYHHGVLRGFLVGVSAPTEVATAAEALYAAAVQNGLAGSVQRISDVAELLLKRLGEATVDRQHSQETHVSMSSPTMVLDTSDADKIAAHIAQHGVTRVESEKPKRKHNMSPEAREAAARRMRDMHARKRTATAKPFDDDSEYGETVGNASAPEDAGAAEKIYHVSGYEMDPKSDAIKLF